MNSSTWIESYVMVAAIDVGTSNSGYAFSYKTQPDVIWMNANWGEKQSCASYKTPSCILTEAGKNGKYVNFGYDAESMYMNSLKGADATRYELYHNFKMLLYTEKNLSTKTKVKSSRGTERSLMDIFTMIIEALKNHLLDSVPSTDNIRQLGDQIRWIITVPAIWPHQAKQFMEQAAKKAGLKNTHTLLALEPEAASIYCRNNEINHFVRAPELYFEKDIQYPPGVKYLLIDAGGGTIDITAHEILENGYMKELHAATGGYWGGSVVNENFIKLLKDVIGEGFIDKFSQECPQQWYETLLKFESAKRKPPETKEDTLNISMPASLDRNYRKWEKEELSDKIEKTPSRLGVSEAEGVLIFSHETIRKLFDPTIDEIIIHITELLDSDKLKNVKFDYLFLVGGFAESPYLQKAVQDHFASQPVLISREAQTSIIRGAVTFGHNPSIIKTRKAKCTYGVSTMVTYDKSIHKKRNKAVVDGISYCKDVFLPFVQKGEDIELNKTGTTYVSPVYAQAQNVPISFHTLNRNTTTNEVVYLDTRGVSQVGVMNVPISSAEEAKLEIMFGGTHIHAKANDTKTGNTSVIDIEFITD